MGTNVPGLQTVSAYQLTVDWTTTGDKGVIISARSGQAFIPTRYSTTVVSVTGTASGSAPTINLGTATGTNFNDILSAAAPVTVGQINAGSGESINQSVTGFLAQHNSDIHIYVPTAVTGSTVLSVTFSLFGTWVAF